MKFIKLNSMALVALLSAQTIFAAHDDAASSNQPNFLQFESAKEHVLTIDKNKEVIDVDRCIKAIESLEQKLPKDGDKRMSLLQDLIHADAFLNDRNPAAIAIAVVAHKGGALKDEKISNALRALILNLSHKFTVAYVFKKKQPYDKEIHSLSIQDLIDYKKFPDIPHGGRLNLTDLFLTSIDGLSKIKDFKNYNQLKSIDLHNNQITAINKDAFAGLNNLTELRLNSNQISAIDKNAFAGLENVGFFRLNNNSISVINENAFAGLNNLTDLDLSNNQISAINKNAFADLNKLELLDLQNNQITTINKNTFEGLNGLEILILSNNKITAINENAFADLNKLTGLDLSNNKITAINENAFAGLNNLKNLNLSNNPIAAESLDVKIKLQLPSDETVLVK